MMDTCEKHDEMIKAVEKTKTLVEIILTNHLPHIEARVNETRKWVIAVFTAVVTALIIGGLKIFSVI